jgi:hypothetical protein
MHGGPSMFDLELFKRSKLLQVALPKGSKQRWTVSGLKICVPFFGKLDNTGAVDRAIKVTLFHIDSNEHSTRSFSFQL